MSEFLAMGGYAFYVWGSYGLAALVLIGLLVGAVLAKRRKEKLLALLEDALERPRRAKATSTTGAAS